MKILSIATILTFTALRAFAGSGELSYNASILNAHQTGTASSPQTYMIQTSSSSVVGSITGSGDFSSVNQTVNENQSEVIGTTMQGYDQVIISVSDEANGLVSISENADLTKNGVRVTISYQAEAKIVAGTWQDYLAGREVTMKLTADGQQTQARAVGDSLSQALDAGIKQQIPNASTSSDVSITEVSDVGSCKVSLQNISCDVPNTKLQVRLQIYF